MKERVLRFRVKAAGGRTRGGGESGGEQEVRECEERREAGLT